MDVNCYVIYEFTIKHLNLPFEISLFRLDEFVKFDEFDEKLPVHTKWLDGSKISLIHTYDYSLQDFPIEKC